ncbi:hypothetical protein SAMN02910456_01643 [Ruminococcaceae bacterium YRB3002]|nr:hypothetical protein SAMN02910456_01643 [Ruminococcaceae bacterium YRB3002]
MKDRTSLWKRVISKLRDNDGTSLILVTVIAIIIVTGIIILRVTMSSLWASADKQLSQDQAYMMATSMGDSIDELIRSGQLTNLDSVNNLTDNSVKDAIPNSEISVSVTEQGGGYTVITVHARVAYSEYDYRLVYFKAGSTYMRQY